MGIARPGDASVAMGLKLPTGPCESEADKAHPVDPPSPQPQCA